MYSPAKIPLQLQKQRQERHQKLMKMISSYELNRQDKAKLEKIKSHTMMEINLRFLRSEINRSYKFPKPSKPKQTVNSSEEQSYLYAEDNEQQEDRILREELEEGYQTKQRKRKRNGQYFVYDLSSQNRDRPQKFPKEVEIKTYSTKVLSLQQSRRVHSLGNQRSQQKHRQDMIRRRHQPIKNSNERFAKSPPNLMQTQSMKTLKNIKPLNPTRKSSKNYLIVQQSILKSPQSLNSSKNMLVDSRKLKLPQINSFSGSSKSLKKLAPIHHSKLKTQKIYEQEDIQYAIGKKLVTETTESGKKVIKGVEKYLKELQAEKQQVLINNQGGRIMRKDKDHQRRKLNPNVLKTAKNSLKRQMQ